MNSNFLYTLLSFFIAIPAFSQIENGSFEQNNGLPSTLGQFDLVRNWSNCGSTTATPDYYHLNGINGGDLPTTPAAIINPCNGSAVMGLTVYNIDQADSREYITTQFTSPLEVNESYTISFRLTNGAVPTSSNAGFGIDKLGMLLSSNALSQNNNDPILANPQFTIDTLFYSRNWQTFSFIIKPTEAFEYLTFGVFDVDSNLDIEPKENNAKIAYYFIDNVQIRKSSDPLVIRVEPNKPIIDDEEDNSGIESPYYIPNSFTPNSDGDNDVFTPVINTDENFEFEVYARWGELIFKTTKKNIGWDGTYKGKPMPEGVYVWTLRYDTFEGEKNVSKQFHGQINLLR